MSVSNELSKLERPVYSPASILFLAASAGIAADRLTDPGQTFWTILLALLLFFRFLFPRLIPRSAFFAARAKVFPNRAVFLSTLSLGLTAAAFGLAHHFYWREFPENELARLIPQDGSPATLEGFLEATPTFLPAPEAGPGRVFTPTDRTFFPLRVEQLKDGGGWRAVSGTVQVMIAGNRSDLGVGERIRISGLLWHPPGARNPGDYDQAASLRARRILLSMSANDSESAVSLPGKRARPLRRFFESLRLRTAATFRKYLSPKNAAMAGAVILGFRSGLDEATITAFRETGTAHLLAISGLHVALVASFFYALFRLTGLSRGKRTVLLAGAVLFYLMMTDLRPSAIRATILILIFCGGVLFHRRAISVNSLCAAAILLLILNPCDLFQLGTHLSFLATGVFLWFPQSGKKRRAAPGRGKPRRLVLLAGRFRRRGRPFGFLLILLDKFLRQILELAVISLTIWLVLLPLILRQLNIVSPIALVINPFIWIPLLCAIASGLMLTLFGAAVPFLCPMAAWPANLFFDLFERTLDFASAIPYGHLEIGGPALWWTFGFYLPLIFWTLFPSTRPKRRTLFLLAALWVGVGFFVSGIFSAADRTADRVRVEVLSVGHGCAAPVLFPDGRTALLDCGSFSSPEGVAQRVKRALFEAGRTRIDLLILSHADADHYNGLFDLLDSVPIRAVVASPVMFEKENVGVAALRQLLEERRISIYEAAAGDSLESFGFPEFSVLHPERSNASDDGESNANSLVISLEKHGRRILFPGDLDAKNPAFLQLPPKHYDVILAPHHGGKSENYGELLAWSTPRAIVISGGRFTRNIASEERLRDTGYRVFNTFDSGAILIELTRPKRGPEGEMTLREFRQ